MEPNPLPKPLPDVLLIAEDDLRRRLRLMSPQLHADTLVMAELIREMVKLEREKLGLDRPSGRLELSPNKNRQASDDPDWTGTGIVAGRHYRVAAWLSKAGFFRVSLLPRKLK